MNAVIRSGGAHAQTSTMIPNPDLNLAKRNSPSLRRRRKVCLSIQQMLHISIYRSENRELEENRKPTEKIGKQEFYMQNDSRTDNAQRLFQTILAKNLTRYVRDSPEVH
jgi:hypothetical protein